MLLAIACPLLHHRIVDYKWIALRLVLHPEAKQLFPLIVGISLIFAAFLIITIGGADMPTVISLLNGYPSRSGAAMRFVLQNKMLIRPPGPNGTKRLIHSNTLSTPL